MGQPEIGDVRGKVICVFGHHLFQQVFLRRGAQGFSGNAKLAAGSNSFGQAAGGVSFGNGVVDVAAQVQHTDTQGFSATNARVPFGNFNADRDGFRQTGGSLRLGWQPLADWRFELLTLQSDGITRIDDGPGVDARAGLENRLISLSARGRVLAGWSTRVSLSEAVDVYETLSSASMFSTLGAIQTRNKQFGWENTIATPLGSVLALAERVQEKVSRPGQPFAVSERDIDGFALGLAGSAAGHTWQASLRRDRNSQFGGASTGALGWGYAFAPAWRVGASLGTSYVAPSFNQLYFPDFGSPTLVPEKGQHAELSLRWVAGEHSLRAAYYEHRYRGFITSGPRPMNLPRAQIDGLTLAYEGRWRALDWAASVDHTDPRNATAGNANFDRQLPRRAKQALRLAADWKAGAFSAGATLASFSHRFDNAANSTRLGGWGTLDLRAEWAITRELSLGARLINVGDNAYETALGYNQPGREGFVTLRYALR